MLFGVKWKSGWNYFESEQIQHRHDIRLARSDVTRRKFAFVVEDLSHRRQGSYRLPADFRIVSRSSELISQMLRQVSLHFTFDVSRTTHEIRTKHLIDDWKRQPTRFNWTVKARYKWFEWLSAVATLIVLLMRLLMRISASASLCCHKTCLKLTKYFQAWNRGKISAFELLVFHYEDNPTARSPSDSLLLSSIDFLPSLSTIATTSTADSFSRASISSSWVGDERAFCFWCLWLHLKCNTLFYFHV